MKDLAEVPKCELLSFINSFNHVLSDLDGVIWLHYKPLSGASACINSLKEKGKSIHYVSNNSTVTLDVIENRLKACGINTEIEDIVIPIMAIISYLKQIKFDRPLYAIALNSIKTLLRDEGFTVIEGPQVIEESITSLISHIQDDKEIGAVLVEFDLNVNYIKLQKAATYLCKTDCLFIAGAGDARLPFGLSTPLIGPYYYLKPLIDFSGREPHQIAKPSIHYNDFITKKFKIENPSRVLFIGDSISEDLNFATKCGYQKLLVLTGITKKEHLSKWEHPEEYKPQYYVESLSVFNELLKSCLDPVN